METKKESRANNELGSSSEEAGLVAARELLKQGILPIGEIAVKTGLSEMVVRGLKGAQVRAEKKLLEAEATTKQTEVISKQEIPIQANFKPQPETSSQEQDDDKTPPLRLSTPGVLFDYQTLNAIEEGMTKQQKANFRSAIALASEKMRLQTNHNDGHGESSVPYRYGEGELEHQMAEDLKWKRYKDRMHEDTLTKDDVERIIEKTMTRTQKESGSELKGLEVLAKLYEMASRGQGSPQRHPLDNLAIEYLVKDVQNAKQHPEGEVNEHRLRLEEMKQSHEVDLLKLKWEMDRYAKGESTTEKVLETLKAVMAGPIGEAIKSLGTSTAKRIERGGHAEPPKVISASCPGCQKSFNVVEGSRQVVCPHCNAVLQLNQPSPQPPPQAPIEQPSEPQAPIPQEQPSQEKEAPQETPEEPKKHPDVLTDF
jgi:hypothetical protein